MKKYLLLLSIASVFAFFSCTDENDEPSGSHKVEVLESPFKLTMLTEPIEGVLEFFYYSVDPGCGFPCKYYIYGETEKRDIVLKCENFDTVYVNQEKSYSYCSDPSIKTDPIDINITDGNYINITLPEIKLDKEFYTEYYKINKKFPSFYVDIYICAEKEGEIMEDDISFYRWMPEWFYDEIIFFTL